MIKGFIFDLDGTLLDRDSSLKAFIVDQYDRISELYSVDKDIYVNRFIEMDNRGYVWKDKVYQQLVQEFNVAYAWEDLLDDYIANFQHHCIGFSNLHEVLLYLKSCDLKLGMITNGFGEFQTKNVRALGIESYFDTILISEIEGIRKPDPEIFIRALNHLGLSPEEAVYVGDHPINDVTASKNIGMKGIWKEDLYYDQTFERDFTVKDLLDLKQYYEAIAR
jgi:putative hydrolase of the HAD superfamily